MSFVASSFGSSICMSSVCVVFCVFKNGSIILFKQWHLISTFVIDGKVAFVLVHSVNKCQLHFVCEQQLFDTSGLHLLLALSNVYIECVLELDSVSCHVVWIINLILVTTVCL